MIELQNQQIGISSVHNARQLGGYIIGDKQVKNDLLLRTARLSSLSAEDSLLLADKFRVQCIYDFRSSEEIQTSPDVIPEIQDICRFQYHSQTMAAARIINSRTMHR